MSDPQQAAIAEYLKQLAELARQRSEIEKRFSLVEKATRAIIDLVDDEQEQLRLMAQLDDIARPAGLSNAVRQALRDAGSKGMTPMEVRDAVGFHVHGHSNPLASVHTVLKRLAKSPDVIASEVDGKTVYRWVSPRTRTFQRMMRGIAAKK